MCVRACVCVRVCVCACVRACVRAFVRVFACTCVRVDFSVLEDVEQDVMVRHEVSQYRHCLHEGSHIVFIFSISYISIIQYSSTSEFVYFNRFRMKTSDTNHGS